MNYKSEKDKFERSSTTFGFDDFDVKLNYAKSKFIVSVVVGILFGLVQLIIYLASA